LHLKKFFLLLLRLYFKTPSTYSAFSIIYIITCYHSRRLQFLKRLAFLQIRLTVVRRFTGPTSSGNAVKNRGPPLQRSWRDAAVRG